MEKKKYYVSVQAESILEDQAAAAYELEIEATEKEVSQLQELFDKKGTEDNYSYLRAHLPTFSYHQDKENDAFDYYLKEIYQKLYDLGTEETKRHIEGMGVLSADFFPYS